MADGFPQSSAIAVQPSAMLSAPLSPTPNAGTMARFPISVFHGASVKPANFT